MVDIIKSMSPRSRLSRPQSLVELEAGGQGGDENAQQALTAIVRKQPLS